MLAGIEVDYYGSPTPVNQIASISIPEPRQLLIKPFDRSCVKDIEKAIQSKDSNVIGDLWKKLGSEPIVNRFLHP